MWYTIFGGVLLGWALGSNDAANVFGTAVASRMVRYRTAIVLAAIFIICGAMIQGYGGIETLSSLTMGDQSAGSALLIVLAAGGTVACMTLLKLPVSTSQAVVGGILGVGLTGRAGAVDWSQLTKIVLCWVGTPTGAALLAFVLYPVLARLLDALKLNLIRRSILLKATMIVGGCYGAYSLGANSTANVAGVFYSAGMFGGNIRLLALIGGLSIALGVLTNSKGVMFTVGSKLVALDAFSATVAVIAQATTVHIYAFVGVPVSTSQAVVGAVLGIGLFKGVRTINRRTLVNILLGWIATPLVSGTVTFTVASIFL